MVKNLPAMKETWVGKIPLEREIAIHFRILAWRIPWTEESGGLVYEVAKRQTQLSTHAHTLNIKAFVQSSHLKVKNLFNNIQKCWEIFSTHFKKHL